MHQSYGLVFRLHGGVGTDLLYAAFTKMVVFMFIIKRISIGPLLPGYH
jgi:hypothetical protein